MGPEVRVGWEAIVSSNDNWQGAERVSAAYQNIDTVGHRALDNRVGADLRDAVTLLAVVQSARKRIEPEQRGRCLKLIITVMGISASCRVGADHLP